MSAIHEELRQYLLPERLERFAAVASQRTRQATVLLEALDKGRNQSAVLRSCDAYGIQDVHVINSERGHFKPSRGIARGSHKWLTIHRYWNHGDAIAHLKQQGYQIWASRLDKKAVPLHELDLTGKIALTFGNELTGVSDEVAEACDGCFMIPMCGFVQSFNVSVAAALTLYELHRQRIAKWGRNGDLSVAQQEHLIRQWVERSVDQRTLDVLSAKLA